MSDLMKTPIKQSAGRRTFGSGLPITTTLLLLASLAAGADIPYTATAWVTSVPVLPIVFTNGAGQVLLRGNVQIARVVGSDSRMTGNRLIFANGNYQADGTALIYGTAYQQVGTYDPNTNFVPTAGVWEITYSGVMQTDNSLQLNLAGYGSGGAIDGMRIQETMTRGPYGAPVDPAVPLLYTGTLKPAPVNTIEVVDDFNTPPLTGWTQFGGGSLSEANQQFVANGYFPGVVTRSIMHSYVLGLSARNWSVPNGRTLEWRADLVSLDDTTTTNVALLGVGIQNAGYAFHKGRDFAYVWKWLGNGSVVNIFSCERTNRSAASGSTSAQRAQAALISREYE